MRQFSEEDEQYLHEEADAAMVDKLSEAILKLSGMVPGATEEAEKLRERPELKFKFRLALALGRTVAELEETISSDELTQWIAFYNMEPFGSERDNIHAGIIASTLANIHGGSKKTWSAKTSW